MDKPSKRQWLAPFGEEIMGIPSTPLQHLVDYTHFGFANTYRVSYPETADTLLRGKPLSFDVHGAFPPSDPATDLDYKAIDRFDRIEQLNWGQRDYAFVDRLAYWYDRVGGGATWGHSTVWHQVRNSPGERGHTEISGCQGAVSPLCPPLCPPQRFVLVLGCLTNNNLTACARAIRLSVDLRRLAGAVGRLCRCLTC